MVADTFTIYFLETLLYRAPWSSKGLLIVEMSSRALRKLQREQEEQRRLAAAQAEDAAAQDSSDDEPQITRPAPKNAFDMLEGGQEDDLDDDDDNGTGIATPATDSTQPTQPGTPSISNPSSTKPKKKKRKPKKKPKEPPEKAAKPESNDEDEVDRALKAIAAKSNTPDGLPTTSSPEVGWETAATKLLGVVTKNLNPINEMKSLFGNVAIEESESRTNRNPRQREVNEQGGMDLGTALLGRNNIASRRKELGALANRRNCLMRGKEEWPLASSGGLSMQHVPDNMAIEKRYNFVHNNAYKESQWNFQMAVESMDPQRMMSLLLMTPYHIASLLQVAEIAKHQGDHSVSGDLLERALFTFGKSVHSTFPDALQDGTARLSFDKSQNREFYLCIWRYIRNLEMRGTFKTAFEWSKLLLQLDTRSDPYGVTLMIDQLALRGRCHDQLISLATDDAYGSAWQHLPNIKISLVLAYMRAKQPREARQQLAVAMHQYPYILSALASALDISPLPKALWAKVASTDAEKLYSELYVSRAKDLWNTPETSALLVEVAETLQLYSELTSNAPAPPKLEISLEEARHIILLEDPHLLALLPRNFTRMATTGYDPLPPPSSESDFTARPPTAARQPELPDLRNLIGAGANATGGLLNRILGWFSAPVDANSAEGNNQDGEAALRELREQLGPNVPEEVIQQLLQTHLGHDDNGDNEQPAIDPTDLGLGLRPAPGGWDYYRERADAPSDEDSDEDDSMPSLADVPTADTRPAAAPTPPPQATRNPRAAMVEEDLDSDDNAADRTRGPDPGRAILRHIDSDDEAEPHPPIDADGIAAHPTRPTDTLYTPTTTRPTAPDSSDASTNTTLPSWTDLEIDADPQRLQRWLLTTGLTELKPGQSSANPAFAEYVRRLRLLRPQQREWVLGVVGLRGGEMGGVVGRIREVL
jgi:tetratricopeptide (TPR) repeat protein